MKKIILLNTHSTLNLGDTGIVLAQIQLLKTFFSDVSISITSRTPEIDQAFYNPFGITVFPPFLPAPSVFSPMSTKIAKTVKNLFQLSAKKQLINAIEESDLVISSGGGYFWSPGRCFPGPMMWQNVLHIQLAALKKKPLFFFPQSFGPFQNSFTPKLISHCLQGDNVMKIFAREEISFEVVKNLLKGKSKDKVEICPDLAFALEHNTSSPSPQFNADLPSPRIALTLRNWEFPECTSVEGKKLKKQKYLTTLKEVCTQIYQRWKGSIVIFPQVRGPGVFENDIPISAMFVKELRSSIPPTHLLFAHPSEGNSPLDLISLLSQIDLIVATRFHSAIFALISGVPAIAIGYQPKSVGIMRLLNLERYCMEIDHMSSKQLLGLIEEILNNHQRIKDMILQNVTQIKYRVKSTLETSIRQVCN